MSNDTSSKKKRKRRYVDILKTPVKRKPVVGWQEVPTDIDRLNTSFARTQMTPEARLQSLT